MKSLYLTELEYHALCAIARGPFSKRCSIVPKLLSLKPSFFYLGSTNMIITFELYDDGNDGAIGPCSLRRPLS